MHESWYVYHRETERETDLCTEGFNYNWPYKSSQIDLINQSQHESLNSQHNFICVSIEIIVSISICWSYLVLAQESIFDDQLVMQA
jgi:hypothetical protein